MSTEGADLPPTTGGITARQSPTHLGRRHTPYAVLAALQVAAASLALGFALLRGIPGAAPAWVPLATGAALIVAAAATRFLLPMLPHDLGLDVALILGSLVAAGATLVTPTAEGQVLIGLALVCYGVMAAYFLPRQRIPWSLTIMLGLYGAAVNVNTQISTPAVYWMIVAVTSGMTLLVFWLVERLRDLALHDELTQLLNRRGLDLLAPALLSACARTEVPVTVGLVDLDQFKLYNDTHGHVAGDRLLQHVAAQWRGQLRTSDLSARFGGDEFAIVLVDTRLADAVALEARVRDACPTSDGSAGPGWTAGWAEVATGEELYDALRRADTLLLDAKRARGADRT